MVGRSDDLHPDAAAFLDGLELPPRPAQTVAAARDALDAVLIEDEPRPIEADVREYRLPIDGGEVPARAYVPTDREGVPVIVYYHGGGWVRGNVETHDDLCRRLQAATGWSVLSVDYRLAPEHPFPAALVDAYGALEWVQTYHGLLNGDPDRVVVAGDSAGGSLAAAVALRARDEDGPDVAAQLLLYPITNHAFDTDSYADNAEGYLLTRTGMRWYWDRYLPRPLHGTHPYASPLRARSHADLPPAVVVTAGYDPLRDEGSAYADALEVDDTPVEYLHYDDMIHAFLSFPTLSSAAAAMDRVAGALEASLDRPGR